MKRLKTVWRALGAVTVVWATAMAGHAATIAFDGQKTDPYVEDGLMFSDAKLVKGNCGPSGPRCLGLNKTIVTTVAADGGGTFSLSSFHFQLLGRGRNNTIVIESSDGARIALDAATYGRNDGGQTFSLAGLSGFTDVMSLTFSKTGRGVARVDDIAVTAPVAAVPLPATGLLMLLPLGLAAARRRRTA